MGILGLKELKTIHDDLHLHLLSDFVTNSYGEQSPATHLVKIHESWQSRTIESQFKKQ